MAHVYRTNGLRECLTLAGIGGLFSFLGELHVLAIVGLTVAGGFVGYLLALATVPHYRLDERGITRVKGTKKQLVPWERMRAIRRESGHVSRSRDLDWIITGRNSRTVLRVPTTIQRSDEFANRVRRQLAAMREERIAKSRDEKGGDVLG